MNNCVSFKKLLISLLLAALICFAGFFAPGDFFWGMILVAFLYLSWGSSYALVASFLLVASLVAAWLCNVITGGVVLLCVFILGTLILIGGIKRRIAYRKIACAFALIIAAAIYLSICLPYVLEGQSAYAGVSEYLRTLDEFVNTYLGDTESYYGYLAEYIDVLLYPIIIIISEALAFLAVFVTAKLSLKAKADIHQMAKFADFELPSSLKIGIPVLAGTCLVLELVGFYATDVVICTVVALIAPLILVQGISTASFVFTSGYRPMRAKPRVSKNFVTILLVISAMFLPMLFITLGIYELYARRRPKMRKINLLISDAFEDAVKNDKDIVKVDFGDGRGPQIIAIRKRRNDDGVFFDGKTEKSEGDAESNKDNKTDNDGNDSDSQEDSK